MAVSPPSHVFRLFWILLLLVILPSAPTVSAYLKDSFVSQFEEAQIEAQIQGYKERGYQWPIAEFVPNTPGWNKLMQDRLEQISTIEEPSERFRGYANTLYSGLVLRNYTEHGFARSRISDSLLRELQQGIVDGFEDRVNEGHTSSITGNQPWYIQWDDLTAKVENELHDKMEEWGKIELDLTYVYGFRLFRNNTTLRMHIDRKGSHALGYILHVGASEDYDPEANSWPFIIEDFQGRTHEITMVPGDLILFEATKLAHGRPHKLNASWYCNVAGHYTPRDDFWNSINHKEEAYYSVPRIWTNEPEKKKKDDNSIEAIEFRSGGMKEPGCYDGWCRSTGDDLVRWKGPSGTDKQWVDANGEVHEFVGTSNEKEDQEL